MPEGTDVKWGIAIAVMLGILSGCDKQSSSPPQGMLLAPLVVGTKTPLYEVVAPNKLKLAPGVKYEVVPGPPDGENTGIVLLRPNGVTGGYIACGCVGAQTSYCKTDNDNPEHPACSGYCLDSEGVQRECEMEGRIGPPKNPIHMM